jgi:hypothetical protein
MKQKARSLKKINKIDKTLANLLKMRREKTQISKIRNEKVEITTNTKEIQGSGSPDPGTTLRAYVQMHWKIFEEMDKFQDAYDHLKWNQGRVLTT